MPQRDKPKPSGSFVPLVTVLLFVLIMVVGLIVLAGRAGVLMMIVVAAVLALPVLHYVTWGRWLSKSLRARQNENERDSGDDPAS
jgi:hypothetical protein